jgi:SPP1 family phage portal protein
LITRDKNIVLDRDSINDCIKQFEIDKTRLANLYDYYIGNSAIVDRERTAGLPNNTLMHGFAQYIATMTSGYLIGDPVQYVGNNLDDLQDAYDRADVQSIDAELALSQAIYGRGVELVYADSRARPRTTSVNPQNAFVVYADDAENLPIFGVYRLSSVDSSGSTSYKSIYVYTPLEIIEYSVEDGYANAEVGRVVHNFDYVPLVEYWNNTYQIGDFESVISLIDAYDVLQSDRVNDKEQFADALLVLTGVVGLNAPTDSEDTRTPAERLKQDRVLSLPDVGAKAEYLLKQLNEADTDVLRASIKSDIHKFSMVPDLSDENFAGNSSGVAMKYKLLGLEQLTKIKERWFREGLRWRLRLFTGFLSLKGSPSIDPDAVQMQFRRSLPVNDLEIAQMVQMLQGLVPAKTLLSQVPFIENINEAFDELKAEKQDNIAAQAAAFGAFPAVKEDDDGGTSRND